MAIINVSLLNKEWRDWKKEEEWSKTERFGQYIHNKYNFGRDAPSYYTEDARQAYLEIKYYIQSYNNALDEL